MSYSRRIAWRGRRRRRGTLSWKCRGIADGDGDLCSIKPTIPITCSVLESIDPIISSGGSISERAIAVVNDSATVAIGVGENDEPITIFIGVVVERSDYDRFILICLHGVVSSNRDGIGCSVDSRVRTRDDLNVSARGLLPSDRQMIAAATFLVDGLKVVTETLLEGN